MLLTVLLPLTLVGCSDSKTLKENQYQVFNNDNTFTIQVTATDIEAENIESVKVKIKYKYALVEYEDGSKYATDIKTKTKTETFEVERAQNASGKFTGEFSTAYPASEFQCEKVVAYYAESGNGTETGTESSSSKEKSTSFGEAIFYALGCAVLGVVILVVLSFRLVTLEAALVWASVPLVVGFLGMLVTGQWIAALVFFIVLGAFATLGQVIVDKLN